MFNAAMDDIAATFNTAQPIEYGGTGAVTVIGGWDALNARGTAVATASSINLTTATGPNLHLTGTTTVATVTLASGAMRFAIADAAFQLTASANLVVNRSTSSNYTTSAGDFLIFLGDPAGVTRVWAIGSGNFLPLSGGTLTGGLVISSSANTILTAESTDAGAAAGPGFDLYRNSASPAASDQLASFNWTGRNTTPAKVAYATQVVRLDDATAGSEDASMLFFVQKAGSNTNYLNLGANAALAATPDAIGLPLGQLSFPATQNPSSNANTLDDYEEGTWTPTMTFNGSSAGVTYGTQVGWYIKIGLIVSVFGRVILTNNGSGVGTALITGLPFTSLNTGATTAPGAGRIVTGGSGANGMYPVVLNNSTNIGLYIPGTTSDAVASDTNCTNTFGFDFSLVYQASA